LYSTVDVKVVLLLDDRDSCWWGVRDAVQVLRWLAKSSRRTRLHLQWVVFIYKYSRITVYDPWKHPNSGAEWSIKLTSSSAERPRDASCLSVVQHVEGSVLAYCRLLRHQIYCCLQLNSVLFSSSWSSKLW